MDNFLIVDSGLKNSIFVIMAGQSNMRGQGTPFPSDLQGSFAGINIWNGTNFVTLNGSVENNNQFGQAIAKFGPEMSFLVELKKKYRNVYCMKYAIGASYLASEAQGGTTNNWSPDEVGLNFDTFVAETNQAILQIPTKTVTGGFFWYQGEADSTTVPISQLYQANLAAFITAYRSETSQPNLKFFITRILNITSGGAALSSPRVRTAQTTYAHLNYGSAYLISVDDLGIEADFTHLTAQGYVDLGIRYAQSLVTAPDDITVLWTDDFDGTVFDTDNWTASGASSSTITQNDSIIITSDHAGTIAFVSGRKYQHRYIISTGSAYSRVKMSWTDPVQTNECTSMFALWQDDNNYIAWMTDVTIAGGNATKIRKRVGGVNTDTTCTAVNGDECKFVFNTSTGAYSLHRWTGSAWSSIGSGTAFTGQVQPIFTANDAATFTGGDTSIFEEFDMTIDDFTTRRPTI